LVFDGKAADGDVIRADGAGGGGAVAVGDLPGGALGGFVGGGFFGVVDCVVGAGGGEGGGGEFGGEDLWGRERVRDGN